jgi:hypothetical protein
MTYDVIMRACFRGSGGRGLLLQIPFRPCFFLNKTAGKNSFSRTALLQTVRQRLAGGLTPFSFRRFSGAPFLSRLT